MTQVHEYAKSDSAPWSPREAELLKVTLELLRQHGYDKLTLDAVAAAARASKATLYRRWPSKAELVLAAVVESLDQITIPPATGTLRDDLVAAGELICQQAERHAGVIRAVLVAQARNRALYDAIQHGLLDEWKSLIKRVLVQAVDRREIERDVIDNELLDLLPGYLTFRSIVSGWQPTGCTVRALIEDMILPGLHRPSR
jgi:AcrR family transcriptional regulator